MLLPLLAWGFFTERDRPAVICQRWWIGLIGILIAGIPVSVMLGLVLNSDVGYQWAFLFFGVLTTLSATFATAIAFRRQGYRFQRRIHCETPPVPIDP